VGKTSLVGSLIAGALLLLAGAAEGAGLGKLTVLSHLGEPLRAEIDVVAPEKRELDTLHVRLGSPEAYLQSNLPYPPGSLGLRIAIDHRPNGEPYIKVTSAQPVPEPFVDLLVELNWQGGKILRAYTALLDPPAFAAAPAPMEAPAAPKPEAAAPKPAPVEPGVETRMGSEMQPPPAETPPAEVAAAPAPTEVAPGEPMPAPPAAPTETTAPPPAEAGMPPRPEPAPKEDTYAVKRGDTLSKIAMQYKPDDVTLDQMLVLLFRSNKSAFSGSNMNRLKTGKILSIPDPSDAAGIPQKQAHREVRLQVADFNSYRQRLASAAGATAPAPDQGGLAAGGKVTAPLQDKVTPPAGEPKEVLKLSQGEPPGTGGSKATQEKVRSLEEEIAARNKTIHEANERIAKLEKTVKDMQGLLELKNKPMADLQKPAVTPPSPAPAAPPPPPPAVIPAPPKPEAPPAVASPPATPAIGPMAASGTQPATAEAEPKPKPKPHPRVVAAPPPPPSLLDDLLAEPTYLAGGGALVALVLGFVGYRIIKGRRGAAADDFGAEKKTSEVGELSASGGETAALMPAPAASPAGPSQPQIAEEVDPLAEAEIYLAYGRDGQAEEILKEALQTQPRRFEIHLKLLEIFAKRKDVPAFDTVARTLQQATGGQGEIWAQAARLGYQIDPSNPRYAAGKPSPEDVAAAAAAAAATAVTTTDKTLDFQIDSLEASQEVGTLTDIDAGFGRRFATTTAASSSADRLDLNVSVDEAQVPGTKTDIDLGRLGPGEDATAVDLDLDSLGGPRATGTGTDINLATFSAEQPEQLPVMDFNLDLPSGGDEKTAGRGESVDFDLKLDEGSGAPGAASPLDFDIDRVALETGGASKSEPVLNLDQSGPSVPEIDLSSISLDLGGAAPAEPQASGKDDKWYDVQTKFDLAKAYQEMGDKEGAREILREVIAEGDAEQKAAAHKVLETLS
jgi:pilus assembly protein FimV